MAGNGVLVYSIASLHISWAAVQTAEFIQKPSGRKRSIPTIRLTLKSHVFGLELFAPTEANSPAAGQFP